MTTWINNLPLCHCMAIFFFSPPLTSMAMGCQSAPPVMLLPLTYCTLDMLLDLMWCKSNDTHLLAKILKCFSWKGFCKDISNLLFCIDVFQPDIVFKDLFTEEVVFDWNMFGSWVHHRILWKTDGASIVTKNSNWLLSFYVDILQGFLHP